MQKFNIYFIGWQPAVGQSPALLFSHRCYNCTSVYLCMYCIVVRWLEVNIKSGLLFTNLTFLWILEVTENHNSCTESSVVEFRVN